MSLELERENAVQVLCHHYAQDRMSTEELEARLEEAYRATTAEELRALLDAYPVVPVGGSQTVRRRPAPGPLTVPERRVLAVFTEMKKRGDWELAHHTRAAAYFASLVLDLREARIPPGVSTIDISGAFAEVKIIVPPGLGVECDGSAMLGEFSQKSLAGPASPDAPALRITGMMTLGSVTVQMRLPDETAREARRREREQ